ncbi:transposase [Palleronia sp.]|uniref:transposase n=1 Tax=Palleronia sp. TaxID=1940284 RepID=UPI0035C83495
MPGVGAVVALTYRSAIGDPSRFTSSKNIGPWVGPTPSRSQSGARDVSGGITKAGDVSLRRALCQAAIVMMSRGQAAWPRSWALKVLSAGAEKGRRWRWPAGSRSLCTACGVDGTALQMDAAPTA